jgi:hypothetical protein
MDPLDLDETTADRLLGGGMSPDDAPPAYRGVARVVEALGRPAAEFVDPADAASGILAAIVAGPSGRGSVERRRRPSRTGIAVVALVGGFGLLGGLAGAGALPGPAQGVAAELLDAVGVNLSGGDDATPAPDAIPDDRSDRVPSPPTSAGDVGGSRTDGDEGVVPPPGAGAGGGPKAEHEGPAAGPGDQGNQGNPGNQGGQANQSGQGGQGHAGGPTGRDRAAPPGASPSLPPQAVPPGHVPDGHPRP